VYALGAASPPINVVNLVGPVWWLLVADSLGELTKE
jgi:hypothetical protein